MIIQERLDKVDVYVTEYAPLNGIANPSVMQFVDYITGGDGKNDRPDNVSLVINEFAICVHNFDSFTTYYHELMQYAARIVGTAGTPYQEQTRAYMLADWAVRTIAPMALDKAGLLKQTTDLRSLQPITDKETSLKATELATVIQDIARDAAFHACASSNGYAAFALFDAARSVRNAADSINAALSAEEFLVRGFDCVDANIAHGLAHEGEQNSIHFAEAREHITTAVMARSIAANRAVASVDDAICCFHNPSDRSCMDLCLAMLDQLIKVTE